jgi:hypothetical protein
MKRLMRTLSWIALALATTSLFAESAAGVRWMAPVGWKAEAARPMRAATYTIPAAAGDKAAGECIVSFFGAGQGGTVDANVERWRGQFRGPDGKPPTGQVRTRTVNTLKVTTLDLSGEYTGMGGPMATKPSSAPGYRLLGAIVEGPGGNLFFKFTGPAKTVAANQQKFEQMVASLQPDK